VFQVAAIDVADIDLPGQDDIPTDDGVHYDVIDGATKRGKKKLISTDGFTYTVKKGTQRHSNSSQSYRTLDTNVTPIIVTSSRIKHYIRNSFTGVLQKYKTWTFVKRL